MKNIILLATFLISSQILIAQKDSMDVISPLLLDKSVLSGVGLKKIDFKDEPDKIFHQKNLYRGEDISVYVVSLGTWTNEVKNFPFDEFIYMLHGEAVVTPKTGTAQVFHSGDYFFAPKGYTGDWEIRAGDNLHYELSVITTRRTDSTRIQKDASHQRFDKSVLSGTAITFDKNGDFEKTLQAGAELTVKLCATQPKEYKITKPEKEKMIQVLSGQITLTNSLGDSSTFYTGDFFVIPKGFTGTWKNEGLSLTKYLVVEKSKE